MRILLGESFSNFANATNSILVGDFLSQPPLNSRVYTIGQGLSLEEYEQVLCICEKNHIKLSGGIDYLSSASLLSTHKHNQKNVLISEPIKLQKDHFYCNLIVFKNNELIIDHQTGQHIQGMILIEAIRQMFIAVAEKYTNSKIKPYVIFNNFKIRFQSFYISIGSRNLPKYYYQDAKKKWRDSL